MDETPEDRIDIASTMAALGQTQASMPGQGPIPATPALPEIRFARTALLGTGGMGVVEGVWDADLMRELAIKRVRPEMRDNARAIAMFLWEARVTAYLDHPNIVPVHDLGRTAAGDPYFAMKRVSGVSLDRVLLDLRAKEEAALERWSLARRLRVLHQVCTAIAFAHRRGVLHRDLKPANIMLGEAGEVMVMDWGLAVPAPGPVGERLRAALPSGVDTASAGTPLYMSPEQARGEPLDERSDVYALGVMLYELLSLHTPYPGATAGDITDRVGRGATRPIRDAWPTVPRALAAIIECCLQPDRSARYESAAALAEDLERYIDGGSPSAEHAPRLTRFARFYVSRDRRLAQLRVVDIDMIACAGTAFGIALGAAFAGSIGSWWWIAAAIGVLATIVPVMAWRRAMTREVTSTDGTGPAATPASSSRP